MRILISTSVDSVSNQVRGPGDRRLVSLSYVLEFTLVAVLLMAGCTVPRGSWRDTFGMAPVGQLDDSLPPDLLAGRMAELEAIRKRGANISATDATRYAQSFSEEIKSDAAVPIKVSMARCLATLQTPAALDALDAALHDPSAEVRSEACRSLSQIDAPRAMTLLTETVKQDPSIDVQLAAARGLGRFKHPQAALALGSVLTDRDPALQYAAMQSLQRSTDQKLGDDVRRWKEWLETSDAVLADRSDNKTR